MCRFGNLEYGVEIMVEYEVKLIEGFRTTEFTAEIQDIAVKEIGGYDKIVFEFVVLVNFR